VQHGAREGAQSEILAAIAQEQAVHGSHWKQQGWQEEAVARVRGRKREGRGWEEGGGGATRKNARREKGERGKKERKKHKRQARRMPNGETGGERMHRLGRREWRGEVCWCCAEGDLRAFLAHSALMDALSRIRLARAAAAPAMFQHCKA